MILAFLILSDFIYDGKQLAFNPSYGAELLGIIGAAIHITRMSPDLLNLIQADSSSGICF